MKKLIPSTDSYYYYTLLDAMAKHGGKLPSDSAKLLKEYNKKFRSSNSRSLELRNLFLRYDKAAPADAKKIIMEINKLTFNLNFDHKQPSNI